MENLFTLPIPVHIYIKKYLTAIYGTKYKLSLTDSIGVYLSTMLQKDQNHIDWEIKISDKSDFYTICFGQKIFEKQGFSVTNKELKYMGDLLDKYFREQCYSFILHDSLFRKDHYKYSLRNFLKVYGITDEELDPESLYKDFMRKKNADSPNSTANLAKKITEIKSCPL